MNATTIDNLLEAFLKHLRSSGFWSSLSWCSLTGIGFDLTV